MLDYKASILSKSSIENEQHMGEPLKKKEIIFWLRLENSVEVNR